MPIEKSPNKKKDLFICHASEDKDDFVRPLAILLQKYGLEVWYDEFELKVGGTLGRSLTDGTLDTNFGLTVFSEFFFNQKYWVEFELESFISLERAKKVVILPLWRNVTEEDARAFSPYFANKIAWKAEGKSIKDIAVAIIKRVNYEIYLKMEIKDSLYGLSDYEKQIIEQLNYWKEKKPDAESGKKLLENVRLLNNPGKILLESFVDLYHTSMGSGANFEMCSALFESVENLVRRPFYEKKEMLLLCITHAQVCHLKGDLQRSKEFIEKAALEFDQSNLFQDHAEIYEKILDMHSYFDYDKIDEKVKYTEIMHKVPVNNIKKILTVRCAACRNFQFAISNPDNRREAFEKAEKYVAECYRSIERAANSTVKNDSINEVRLSIEKDSMGVIELLGKYHLHKISNGELISKSRELFAPDYSKLEEFKAKRPHLLYLCLLLSELESGENSRVLTEFAIRKAAELQPINNFCLVDFSLIAELRESVN